MVDMTRIDPETLDMDKVNEFVGRFVGDLGAAMHATTVVIGERLGLWAALAEHGPQTAEQLAKRTRCDARYVGEWLNAQAASQYAHYDPQNGTYYLSPEQAFCLAQPTSPAYLPGGMQIAVSVAKDAEVIEEAFSTGKGVSWGDHHEWLFSGTEKFFRAGYVANLVDSWLPSLDGVVEKLRTGARVADVGCGHGASTILMGKAFPHSSFIGYDSHLPSIDIANKQAAASGVASHVNFEVASATDFAGENYDLIAMFDCLHDMADPDAAAAYIRRALAPEGTLLLVEPYANDAYEDNHNPIGRVFYSASTMICTPSGRWPNGGAALGAQAGEAILSRVLGEAGFSRVRRATETPFNLVLEARP